jgi:xanthine/uracil/vitamin C permease (AzgA family)
VYLTKELTGLTAIVVAIYFLISIFFAPLTASVEIFVHVYLTKELTGLTAIVVAIYFLISIFFAPLTASVEIFKSNRFCPDV